MCFEIDTAQTEAPKEKYGYKVVRLQRGLVYVKGRGHVWSEFSTVHSNHYSRHEWSTGEHLARTAQGREIPINRPRNSRAFKEYGSAAAGIYVFLDIEQAEAELQRWGDADSHAILKVKLDPKDWLHTSFIQSTWGVNGRIATYRRVVVNENQPQIRWYD